MMKKYANVLVVEDDKTSAFLLKLMLLESDLVGSIAITSNGQEALDYLSRLKVSGGKYPEIIFLDINMPVMDGFDFLEASKHIGFRENEKVKVIILTSSVHEQDIRKAKAFGVTNYLVKPISEEAILAAI
jgi:CheY-like chemotaxis protein